MVGESLSRIGERGVGSLSEREPGGVVLHDGDDGIVVWSVEDVDFQRVSIDNKHNHSNYHPFASTSFQTVNERAL
jgi:hypothetical protein